MATINDGGSRFSPIDLKAWRIPILVAACLFVIRLDVASLTDVREGLTSVQSSRDASTARSDGRRNELIGTTAEEAEKERLHSSHQDIVDLLDWEEASLRGMLDLYPNVTSRSAHRTCKTPDGVSDICCLGSFSNGGATTTIHRHRCAKPLHNLEEVKQHTHQFFQDNPVHTTEQKCDICQVLDLARRDNLTIALIGDSMHNQIYDGLACELERRNYLVDKTFTDLNPTKSRTWIYRRHTSSEALHIRSPSWSSTENNVTIQFHRIYSLPLIDDSMAGLTAQADVVVLGFGLHYWYDNTTVYTFKRMDSYIQAMSTLFQNVTEQNHVKLLVHRETSAQHFDANGGEFVLWYNNRTNLQPTCQQFSPTDSSVAWREKAIQSAAFQSGHNLVQAGPNMMPYQENKKEVVVLPYFNFTSQHFNMHPTESESDDCTHYCSSPYVYYPLWRSLRFAMDRQFGTKE